MKIAISDKSEIINKIKRTLIESHTDLTQDSAYELLAECYCDWYDKNITPYRDHPLEKLIPRQSDLNQVKVKFEIFPPLKGAFGERESAKFEGIPYLRNNAGTRSFNPTRFYFTETVTDLDKKNIPVSYNLITLGTGYYRGLTIPFDSLDADLQEKIIKRATQIAKLDFQIATEISNLQQALDEVNTYGQLKKNLPVIFNAMPIGLKDKYDAYRKRITAARKKKNEPLDLADFTEMGKTLAIASLKRTTE